MLESSEAACLLIQAGWRVVGREGGREGRTAMQQAVTAPLKHSNRWFGGDLEGGQQPVLSDSRLAGSQWELVGVSGS